MSKRKPPSEELSRRERQIMESIYRRGRASVIEIAEDIPNAPTPGAMRTMLKILENKGLLSHETEGLRHFYRATVPRSEARKSVLRSVVATFFGGSSGKAVSALLDSVSVSELSDADVKRLSHLIAQKREKNKK